MNDYENIKSFLRVNSRKILGGVIGFAISILVVKYGFLKMLGILITTTLFAIIFDNLPKDFSLKDFLIKIMTKGEDY